MSKSQVSIPSSKATVKLSVIDSTLRFNGALCSFLWKPAITGWERFTCGSWSTLIEHPSGQKVLFDLGIRKDWKNLPPSIGLDELVGSENLESLAVDKNVSEILSEGGMKFEDIDTIIWSHYHYDHTGDPSAFPSSTKIVVGPGFKDAFMPGYPKNKQAHQLESDFQEKEVQEIEFESKHMKIGGFKALDYFGDGSLYLLYSPGHALGHISALIRTQPSPEPSFVHLTGDCFHHIVEIRPSSYAPLPDALDPSPVPDIHPTPCPAHVFSPIFGDHPRTSNTIKLYDIMAEMYPDKEDVIKYIDDEPALRETLGKVEEFDAAANILTLGAHDWTLKGAVPEWPNDLNSWKESGLKRDVHWAFFKDMEGALL